MITAVDESEGPEEELHLTNCLPDGLCLFEHLRDQEAPLRMRGFPAHLRSLGLSEEPDPRWIFSGTLMRRRGAHIGNFFAGDKEGAGASPMLTLARESL